MVREGLLQDARGVRRRPRPRRSPAPTGSWPSSTTPTPTRATRSRSRRSPPPTTSSATPSKRKEYDEVRALGPAAGGFGGGGFPGGFGGRAAATFRVDDIGDSRRPVRRPVRPRTPGPAAAGRAPARRRPRGRAAPVLRGRRQRGDHLGQPDHRRPLPHLPGHRGRPRAPSPVDLPALRRHGHAPRQPGPLLAQPDLPAVRRDGAPWSTTPCPTCRGTGVEHRNRPVKVRIPAGVEDGQRIRVKGRGAAGRGNGGPRGDLYVVVHVDRHPAVRPARAAT